MASFLSEGICRLESYLGINWIGDASVVPRSDLLVWTHPFFSHDNLDFVSGRFCVNDDSFLDRYVSTEVSFTPGNYLSTLFDVYQQSVETKFFEKIGANKRNILFGVGISEDELRALARNSKSRADLFSDSHISKLTVALDVFDVDKSRCNFFLTTNSAGFLQNNAGYMRNNSTINCDVIPRQYFALKSLFTNKLRDLGNISLTGTNADVCMLDTHTDLKNHISDFHVHSYESVYSGLPALKPDEKSAVYTKLSHKPAIDWNLMKTSLGVALKRESAKKIGLTVDDKLSEQLINQKEL